MKNTIDTSAKTSLFGGFKKHLLSTCLTGALAVGLLSSGAAFASPDLIQQSTKAQVSHTAISLGTPASFLQDLDVEGKSLAFAKDSSKQKIFKLINNLGEDFIVEAHDFSLEKDGTLSMSGSAVGYKNSKFIMQGNDDKVYGWLILEDANKAFEYTTENGQLMVDEIAITDVRPICEFKRVDGFDFEHQHEHSYEGILERSSDAFDKSVNAGKVEPHIGAYNGEDVSRLESKPGSSYVLLLDTSRIMNGNTPTDRTPENLYITWQIVAASFSMFDINVTTDRSVYDQAAPSKRGGGTLYTQSGRSSCHFAFGTSTFCTLYKESDAYGQGRIAAHEYGHLFHLAHDGGAPGGEYHQGLADFEWVPVMGNIWFGTSWNNALYQWSKGEYSGASNREDDFNIITSFVPYKADDAVGARDLTIDSSGGVSASQNYGQIERNTDSDSFTFHIGEQGGSANLTIDRIEHIGGGMLDVQATLRNGSGSVVAQSNKSVNRSASISTSLSPGSYTLVISGGAEGTASHGFTKYSSLGYYGIEGTITGVDGGGSGTEIPGTPSGLQATSVTGDSFVFSWDDTLWATSYNVQHSTDGASTWTNLGDTSVSSMNISNLSGTDHWVRVNASSQFGSSSYSNSLYVRLADVVTAPSTPTGLSSSNVTSSSFTASWNNVSGATNYDLQLWQGAWVSAGSTSSNSYNLTGLSGQDQWVRVRATNSAGNSSYSNYIYVQLQSAGCTVAPSVPSGLSGNSSQINWNSVSGATGYDVQYWLGYWANHGSTSATSYNLGLSGTQYVRIRAKNSCGSSNYSSWIRVD